MFQKTIKWSLILSLAGNLSSCLMYDQNSHNEYPQNATVYKQGSVNHTKAAKAAVKANNSISKEPVQKSTPGPKRAAAPQLPVLQ